MTENQSGATEPPPTKPSRFSHLSDDDFYTWRTTFKLLTGQGTRDDHLRYNAINAYTNADALCAQCERWRDEHFKSSPVVRFLSDEIARLGHALPPSKARCRICPPHTREGGFSPRHGILLCANELRTKSRVENVLAHELVHAYDHLRFDVRGSDNLRHAACMEIRAVALSGECRFMHEVVRNGNWGLAAKFQECVRRRATLSVLGRRKCEGDRERARAVVDSVWESCFRDTRPFDEVYR